MKMLNVLACGLMAACTSGVEPGGTGVIQDVGLATETSAVTVPPLGEGVAPIMGYPGAGAPAVDSVGGWSSGPGAVQWHGGQWLIPYVGHPGQSIANVACDVVPRADATDLIELVGTSGVIGSVTVPATTANVTIRSWIQPSGGHVIADGEQIVMRHSPRDSTTGTFTSALQPMTVIGCFVNTVQTQTLQLSFASFVGTNLLGYGGGGNNVRWQGSNGVFASIPLPVGATITAIRATVRDNQNGPTTLNVMLRSEDLGNTQGTTIATSPTSSGDSTLQTLSASVSNATITAGSVYWLQVGDVSGTAVVNVYGAAVDYF